MASGFQVYLYLLWPIEHLHYCWSVFPVPRSSLCLPALTATEVVCSFLMTSLSDLSTKRNRLAVVTIDFSA